MTLSAFLWAWQEKLSPHAKITLMAICERLDPGADGVVLCNLSDLERDTGLTASQLGQAVYELDRSCHARFSHRMGGGMRFDLAVSGSVK